MIMMGGDRKKSVVQILGPDKSEEGEKSPSDLSMSASDLISAIKSEDPEAVASALRACYAAVQSEGG